MLSGAAQARCFLLLKEDVVFLRASTGATFEQQIIVDPMLTSELRYGDLWSMREFNHFDFELNGIIRGFFYALRLMISWIASTIFGVHYSSQEFQDLPDGAETTLTLSLPFNQIGVIDAVKTFPHPDSHSDRPFVSCLDRRLPEALHAGISSPMRVTSRRA